MAGVFDCRCAVQQRVGQAGTDATSAKTGLYLCDAINFGFGDATWSVRDYVAVLSVVAGLPYPAWVPC